MSLTDLPVLVMLKSKLKWHQTRQRVLAENIANADTPGYKARDLKQLNFERALQSASQVSLATKTTNPRHFLIKADNTAPAPGTRKVGGWEVSPSGNAVSLEEQMMKITQNQMDYNAASTLYSRALGLIRIALDGGR